MNQFIDYEWLVEQSELESEGVSRPIFNDNYKKQQKDINIEVLGCLEKAKWSKRNLTPIENKMEKTTRKLAVASAVIDCPISRASRATYKSEKFC